MLKFNCRVTVGPYTWPTFSEFSATSTWKTIGDTGTVTLPGLRSKLEKLISTGMPVKVECGYNGQLFTEFEGYVSEIMPNVPFQLKLEDEAYRLKRLRVGQGKGKAWKKVSLRQVLDYIYDGTKSFHVPEVDLSPFRIEAGVSVYAALVKIKEEFGLTIYFRGKTLFAGLAYTDKQATDTVIYRLMGHWERQLPPNVVSSDLTFKRREDVRLGVRAVSVLRSNKRLEVKVGDEEGDQFTLHFYNVTSETTLRRLAIEKLARVKFEGYRGTITTWGIPYIEHGMAAKLLDPYYPEREMTVFVDEVKVTVSKSGGFRRVLQLGRKASV